MASQKEAHRQNSDICCIIKEMRRGYKTDRARDLTEEVKQAAYRSFLTGEKPTASLLARRAGINRSTFYRHFYDVDDVISSIEDDIFQDVEEVLAGLDYEGGNVRFFHEVVALVEKNIPFLSYLLRAGGMGENRFFQRIIEYAEKNYLHGFLRSHPRIPAEECRLLFLYTLNGSIALIADWLRSDRTIGKERFAEMLDEYNRAAMGSLIRRGRRSVDVGDFVGD